MHDEVKLDRDREQARLACRLFPQLHQRVEMWERMPTMMRCPICGTLAMHHPYPEEEIVDGVALFHRLCDGTYVHL